MENLASVSPPNQVSAAIPPAATGVAPRSRRWWLIAIAASVCVLSWIALAVGLVLGVGFTPRLVLATAAALSSEALVWIVAGVLGLRLLEARQRIWQRLRALAGR